MASQLPNLPKTYVDMIPVYKGDPKKLLRFIQICDQIHGYLERSEDREKGLLSFVVFLE